MDFRIPTYPSRNLGDAGGDFIFTRSGAEAMSRFTKLELEELMEEILEESEPDERDAFRELIREAGNDENSRQHLYQSGLEILRRLKEGLL